MSKLEINWGLVHQQLGGFYSTPAHSGIPNQVTQGINDLTATEDAEAILRGDTPVALVSEDGDTLETDVYGGGVHEVWVPSSVDREWPEESPELVADIKALELRAKEFLG